MAGMPHSSTDPRAALQADAMAAQMALAADALQLRGDIETAESLRAMARHNRILGLKLRVEHGLAPLPSRDRVRRQGSATR